MSVQSGAVGPYSLLLFDSSCFGFAAVILWFLTVRHANVVASWSGFPMSTIPHWSIVLQAPRSGRRRWLSSNGRFSCQASRALRLVSPEVAASRLQVFRQLHGWSSDGIDRLRLVPSPPLDLPLSMSTAHQQSLAA